jgi:hypothetical protein
MELVKGEETGDNYIMRIFIICTLHEIVLGSSNQGERDARGV